ncbi:GNAT family N-acetyltransferase [Galbibacter mesophilus]|uniref:GNAT family N-acetyltransferase n=1 Tax=Galbibacter mesophilus TaxID=379069 RepID=UPI00191E3DC2|nr:GNAT family N-acetyltransferase [Galbibacter mesophilus]MCM5663373.1 GNAT family N-acetyltransferase [Galbibacter mesophilus]
MTINFTPITIEDKATVLRLFKEAAEKIDKKGVDHWQYWKNPPAEKVKWVEEGLKNDEFFFIHDVQNNDTIGMVRILKEDLLYWGKQVKKAKYVHSLVIKENYNGKGIGTKVLKEIAQQAKNDSCEYLRLDADAKNPKLCNYYEKQGFKKVGTKQLPLSTYNLYEMEL